MTPESDKLRDLFLAALKVPADQLSGGAQTQPVMGA
jgi:hypothetical protein